jgi:hypothetical protein
MIISDPTAREGDVLIDPADSKYHTIMESPMIYKRSTEIL